MIEVGKYAELEILRETSVGLFLGDEEGDDVLLPIKYYPESFEIGDTIEVFIYRDYAERKIATNIIPKIHLKEFALLEVADVTEHGAFMDWGMEKSPSSWRCPTIAGIAACQNRSYGPTT